MDLSVVIVLWIVSGIAAAYVATQKNKELGVWFFLGLLLGPIALLMVGLSPSADASAPQQQGIPTRKCPYCAEVIKGEAILCRFCGKDVEPMPQPAVETRDIYIEFGKILGQYGGYLSRDGAAVALSNKGFEDKDIDSILLIKFPPKLKTPRF